MMKQSIPADMMRALYLSARKQRLTRTATGAPEYSYAVDFETVDRIEALPDGAYGTQATQESMRDLLASLPPLGSDGYNLSPQIAFNTTPFQDAVPEPATWAMTLGGFVVVGSLKRRRRKGADRVSGLNQPL